MSYGPSLPILKPCGDFMFEARHRRNVSRVRLAAAAGLSSNTIYEYEAGRREPRLTELCRLTSALNCSLDEYVGWDYLQHSEIEVPPDKIDEDSLWIIRTDVKGNEYTVCPKCGRATISKPKVCFKPWRMIDLREANFCPMCGARLYKEESNDPAGDRKRR